jgi:hypothetical protein
MTDPRITRADQYSALALHNLGESAKLGEWIDRRKAKLTGEAADVLQARPTTVYSEKSLGDEYIKKDARISEWSSGQAITERRATMYASMAQDLRMQVLGEMLQRALQLALKTN